MKNREEIFWTSTVEEIVNGFIYNEATEEYTCLICGESFAEGIIYQKDHRFMDAKKTMQNHITEKHDSVFDFLINLSKRYTGLTDIQKDILTGLYQGLTDKEIVKNQGGKSPSTIRNHRFKLREKEKQARVYLALMSLLESSRQEGERFEDLVDLHREAKMVDDRYVITQEERKKVLKNYLKDGKVEAFPSKEKKKLIILQYIIENFEGNKIYTEKEVNEIIKGTIDDFVTVRRYLIQYGFLDRKRDCSEYWLKG